MKVGIIGAGFTGLATAAYLAKSGHEVIVLEKNHLIGGRARLWQVDGFTFDMGPSWYLMPEVFERFFEHFDTKRETHYRLDQLDPYYRVYFSPTESVDVTGDLQETKRMFDRFEPSGGKRLSAYLERARYKYETAMDQFLYRDYDSIFQFLNRRMLTEGMRLGVLGGLDREVSKSFKDRRAKQLLEYAMVFLGTAPKDAPGLYSIMSHVDLNLGVWFPEGGMGAVAKAIGDLAATQGARIRVDAEVLEIETTNGRATGLRTAQGTEEVDVVINTGDYAHGELELLESDRRSFGARYWSKRTLAPSMFLIYLGLGRRTPGLAHHNLYFQEHWDDHFARIFDRPGWPVDPNFYLSRISATQPSMAPQGAENLFFLVPVAPGLNDTDDRRETFAEHVLDHAGRVTGENFQDDVLVKRVYSQRDFAADYHAYRGTALGLAHTLRQTAVFRPGRRSKKLRNLFYAGQYTHPGVGVPMTLIAAELAARAVEKEAARAR